MLRGDPMPATSAPSAVSDSACDMPHRRPQSSVEDTVPDNGEISHPAGLEQGRFPVLQSRGRRSGSREILGGMDTAVIIALIALAGSLVSTFLTVFGAPVFQARRDAKKVLDNYREPLVAAAFELQARLYNILQLRFVEKYIKGEVASKRGPALESTLYVFAQFFGWRELIRREVQYLRFSRNRQTREVGQLLRDIGETFLSESYGPQFMIWRVEQRGIGERMIESEGGQMTCLGYASFIKQRSSMEEWLVPLGNDLENLQAGGRQRLTELQHMLVKLVRQLDDKQKRYPFELKEA